MSNTSFNQFILNLENSTVPVAVALPLEQKAIVGSIVKIDGRTSREPNGDPLTYTWTFSQIPIGSQVERFGFTDMEDDSSVVSFAPDVTGTYKIQLVVDNGSVTSEPFEVLVDVRVILVPYHEGFVPDASFIWNYLSDFWTVVQDKKKFETFWSLAIQVVSSEVLKLYQYDYAKSIRDVQDTIQKRWVPYTPSLQLALDKTVFVLSDDQAGVQASTFVLDPVSGVPLETQPATSTVITIPLSEGDFSLDAAGTNTLPGRIIKVGDRSFTVTRTLQVKKSLNYAIDGTTSGVSTFKGTQFTSDMVGATLRILSHEGSPSVVGDYIIATFVSDTEITVTVPVEVTWAAYTDIEYTVLPLSPNYSSIFVDLSEVPAGLDSQPWRFSSTLISQEHDFEKAGVSEGDVIELEIERIELGLFSTFFAQVVSVDRNRLGFVLNLDDLVEGEEAGWLTDDIQLTLANDLIVTGISVSTSNELSYSFDSKAIKSTISSLKFRRTYFQTKLTPYDDINVGPFSIRAKPVRIIRNKKMAVDTTVISVPMLQEYIKQPSVAVDGDKTYLVTDEGKQEVSRQPYVLSENLDYVLDDEGTITGVCSTTQGSDEIVIPYGDLIDRSIREGDYLDVELGMSTARFYIRKVLSSTTVRVYPIPSTTSSSANFALTRRVFGRFIRFIDGLFSKTSPAPDRLWAEVTYFDNNELIENNFGVLVGITRDDIKNAGSSIPYKSAVAGLMYALSNGPTISNLKLSSQILFGLPFAQNLGVVTSIDPTFRRREDGSPKYGRILIEGRNSDNKPTGITNIYLYPLGRQLFDTTLNDWVSATPDSSGLGINPDTEEEYKVGDEVSQFAILSKGVDLAEYLTTPEWFDNLIAQGNISSRIQKYHSFQLKVNSDLVSSADIDLVVTFLKKAKAHYIMLTTALVKSVEEFVEIEDDLFFGRLFSFFENVGLSVPTAARVGRLETDGTYLHSDGIFYTRYLVGSDLSTVQGSSVVESLLGGFVDPRAELIESWDTPFLRAGDVLVITEGSNRGRWPIVSVGSDTQLTVDLSGEVFETLEDQRFTVYRPIVNPIWEGNVEVDTGSATVSTEVGIGSAGVAAGDTFIFHQESIPFVSRRYTVTLVTPDDTSPEIEVSPDIVEGTGTYPGFVVRERLLPKTFLTAYIDCTVGDDFILFADAGAHVNSWKYLGLIRPGDLVEIDGTSYTIMRFDPLTHKAVVTPDIGATFTDEEVEVTIRPERSLTPVPVDFVEHLPEDYLGLTAVASVTTGPDAVTTAGSTDVTLSAGDFTDLNALPGDYLVLLEGNDSLVDVGNGAGIYPIKELTAGGGTVRLMDQLTQTGNFRFGLLRSTPNEG